MLSIGEAEGAPEYLLSEVRSVWRLESGEIVATSGTSEFRYFDATGRHLRTVGKRGGGPGEFQMLSWVQPVAGDSILAYDMAARRLSIFAPDGAFVRSTALGGSPEAGTPQLLGALGDGSLVGSVGASIGRGPAGGINGLVRGAQDFLHLAASGETLDTISRQPGSERFIQSQSSSGQITSISVMATLFGRSQVATVTGDRIILGGNDSYQLEVYTRDGRLERLIRRDVPPRPVTDDDLESALQARLESISDPARRENTDREYRKMPLPETMPYYQAALADAEGNLWVQDFSPGEPPAGWSVFDPEGRFLGTVAMPDRFRPQQIGEDFILGVARDELDVERVQIYPLEKP
jgi:hypothetical protein